MQSKGRQAADFIEVLYPTIKAAGLTTEIACCDASGWEQQRERLTDIQAAGAEKYFGIITALLQFTPSSSIRHRLEGRRDRVLIF